LLNFIKIFTLIYIQIIIIIIQSFFKLILNLCLCSSKITQEHNSHSLGRGRCYTCELIFHIFQFKELNTLQHIKRTTLKWQKIPFRAQSTFWENNQWIHHTIWWFVFTLVFNTHIHRLFPLFFISSVEYYPIEDA